MDPDRSRDASDMLSDGELLAVVRGALDNAAHALDLFLRRDGHNDDRRMRRVRQELAEALTDLARQ